MVIERGGVSALEQPYETKNGIIDVFMKPYDIKDCRYLQSAEVTYPEASGRFSINDSCYIQSTGHFNMVEAIICYNQLAYQLFAQGFNKGVIENVRQISYQDFEKYQLANSLIVRSREIKFGGMINAHDFEGKVSVKRSKTLRDAMFADTEFEFWDDNGGKASGMIRLAMAGV